MSNKNFENIKNLKFIIDDDIVNIKNISIKLIEYYHDLIKEYNTTLFIFGIDSLYFQNKLIENELSNLLNLYELILNRMYCEYFKLYKMILTYINNHFSDHEVMSNLVINDFPKYDDLDIFKKYDFSLTINIQVEINNLFSLLKLIFDDKIEKLNKNKMKKNYGLNIDNFVNTYGFEVNNLEQQIKLFYNYLHFFYDNHYKNLKRIKNKFTNFYKQINYDLNFNNVDETNNEINDIDELNDTIYNSIDINQFNDNDYLNINELFEINEMFKNDLNVKN